MNRAVAPKLLSFAAEFEGMVVLTLPPEIAFSEDEFFEFCQANYLIRIERSAAGEIILQPLCGADISWRNAEVVCQLRNWSKRMDTGPLVYGRVTYCRMARCALRR